MSRNNQHNCAVSSCGLILPLENLMCKEHWAMVPKPMQDAVNKHWRQGGGAGYLAARAAAVRSVQAQLRPDRGQPVPASTSSTSSTKSILSILLVAVALATQGCALIGYKNPDGTKFIALTCLSDDKIAKLAVSHTTKATATGLAIGSIDHQVDDEAFKAMVSGAVEGTIKGLGFGL